MKTNLKDNAIRRKKTRANPALRSGQVIVKFQNQIQFL
ncbi:hypothetical protein LEP1GSC166_2562 [Leptospira kirschneri]|nr:hypothetical protein LEP1GSC198_2823 [Leptospira kirschneri str. JB]EMK07762.1 hypothetical protein LEP1GSC166_2562 [Leptospira kirschneri]